MQEIDSKLLHFMSHLLPLNLHLRCQGCGNRLGGLGPTAGDVISGGVSWRGEG